MIFQKKYRGFALMELMIVVAIVGILAVIVLPNYSAYVQRGKVTEAAVTLAQQQIIRNMYLCC